MSRPCRGDAPVANLAATRVRKNVNARPAYGQPRGRDVRHDTSRALDRICIRIASCFNATFDAVEKTMEGVAKP